MLTAGIIVAGWDKHKGGQVFAIPVGGGLLPRPFAIGGSGSTYIYGFCDAYYRPGMNAQQCEEFVAKALCHAMARDGSSGGVIRTVRIDEAGVERKMIPGNKLPVISFGEDEKGEVYFAIVSPNGRGLFRFERKESSK